MTDDRNETLNKDVPADNKAQSGTTPTDEPTTTQTIAPQTAPNLPSPSKRETTPDNKDQQNFEKTKLEQDSNNNRMNKNKNDNTANANIVNDNDKNNPIKSDNVVNTNSLNNVNKKPAEQSKAVTNSPEPKMKKADIAIAGTTYSVYCPVDEEDELRSAVHYINNFALEIKKDAPNLSQENLLVLSCLNLYEKINANKKRAEERKTQDDESEALLQKIIKDAQSVL